jgi:REP element-mobilizing transposase RayT
LAVRLSRTITIAQLIEKLKTASSKWLKTQSAELDSFAWQNGYAAFSISPGNLEALRQYIDHQEEHHQRHDFQEEMRTLLKQYGVEFDERYVWD